MKIYCFEDGRKSNFGDDLNGWLWEELLPGCWDGTDENTLFCGIGSIIGKNMLPPAERYIVFGSGTGYDPPPKDFGESNWTIHCVRGPLTAHVLGLEKAKAIADGAVLVSLLPQFSPVEESDRKGIVFMPHYEALHAGNWREAAERAGLQFLDPHVDSRKMVETIRGAKLVVADAMHAAIVADSLRVPWVPVRTSGQINSFKWLDWTLSVGVPYRPLDLPSSSWLESARDATIGWYGHRFALKNPTAEMAVRHYVRTREWKAKSWWVNYGKWMRRFTYAGPRKIVTLPVISGWRRQYDGRYLDCAAEALRKASETTSYLSDETIFRSRVQQLWECLIRIPEIAGRRP